MAPGARRVDANYIVRVLTALDELRSDAASIEDVYSARLVNFADAYTAVPDDWCATEEKEPPPVRRMQAVVGFARSAMIGVLWMLRIPTMLWQARTIARLGRSGARRTLVVVLPSNRLTLGHGSARVRAVLAALASPLAGRGDPTVARKINAADAVLMFDPLLVSRLWTDRRRCRQDGVFILDVSFLMVFLAFRLLARPTVTCSNLAAVVRSAHEAVPSRTSRRRCTRVLCQVLIAQTCAEVLNGLSDVEAVFFTCNSVLAEVLRANLIKSPQCKQIFEIMHGVGSLPAERFFSAVLEGADDAGAYQKHTIVPQVPNLPLHGVFARQAHLGARVAVNAYVNQYFINRSRDGLPIDQFVEAEYKRLYRGKRRPVVVNILGNTRNDRRLLDSPSFRAECMIIVAVREFMEKQGRECLILYSPHPVHGAADFTHPVFQRYDVTVYRNSVFCWLVSDICTSLLSSSMIEASYFGVRAFTPLIPSDRFFTRAYLDMVRHPASPSIEDFTTALDEWLREALALSCLDVPTRARARLTRMTSVPRSPGADASVVACVSSR